MRLAQDDEVVAKLQGKAQKPKQRRPLPHQARAISEARKHFIKDGSCHLQRLRQHRLAPGMKGAPRKAQRLVRRLVLSLEREQAKEQLRVLSSAAVHSSDVNFACSP
jgi:hypothetical protein